jgi:hypothetical protein
MSGRLNKPVIFGWSKLQNIFEGCLQSGKRWCLCSLTQIPCYHASFLGRTVHIWQWWVLKTLKSYKQAKYGEGPWRTYLAASMSCDPIPFLLRDGTTQIARNPQTAGTACSLHIMAPGPWLSSLFLSEWLCRLKTSLLKLIFPNSNVRFVSPDSVLLSGTLLRFSDEELGITLCAAFIGSATRHPTILPPDTNR